MSEFRIVVPTSCFEASSVFYDDVLGWPVTKEWTEPDRGRIFGCGPSARVELLERPEAGPVADVPYCAIQLDDVRSLHDRLTAAAVFLEQPLADQPWGHRTFAVRDPNGLRLVFFEVIG